MRKTKRALSLVLAAMMIISMLVVGTVAASAAVVDESVANVKLTKADGSVVFYDQIPGMPTSGGTYTVLKDYTQSTRIAPGVFGSTFTIDLGGYTMTCTQSEPFYLRGTSASTTVKNGTIKFSGNLGFSMAGATLNVCEGAKLEASGDCCAIFVGSDSTINIEGGTVTAKDSFAIAANGSSSKNYTINIKSGNVSSTNTAIYHNNAGTLNISGGTITGRPAVYIKSGVTNITGGTIQGVGEAGSYGYNGNGTNPVGDALVVDDSDYPGGTPVVNITGGDFSSENGNAVSSHVPTDDANYTGTINNEPVKNFVAGGTFDKNVPADLVAGGVSFGDGGTGTFVVTDVKTYSVGDQGFDEFIDARNYARANAPATIKVLKDASFPADTAYGITTDTTIDLMGNTLTGSYPLFVVMNGANCTVTNGTVKNTTDSAAIRVLSGSTLTIDKSATVESAGLAVSVLGGTVNVNGTAKSTGRQAIECQYYDGATATVNVAGNVEGVHGIGIYGDAAGNKAAVVNVNSGANVTASGFAIYSNGNNNYDYNINVKAGSVVTSTNGTAIYHCNNGTLTISGGTINGKTGVFAKSGKTVVSGGTINATGAAKAFSHNGNGSTETGDALLVENCSYPGGAPSIEIKGGTFNSANAKAVASYAENETYPKLNNFITKGTFSSDVSDLAVSGKFAQAGTNGKYTIKTDVNKLTANHYGIEGYQNKVAQTSESDKAEGNDINTKGVRIVTKFDNSVVGASDYGYVVAKYNGNKAIDLINFDTMDTTSGNGQKVISCKDSVNTVLGDDYVTLAVNGMSAGDKVVARFYAVVGGTTYYSDYISSFGNANSGILVEFAEAA